LTPRRPITSTCLSTRHASYSPCMPTLTTHGLALLDFVSPSYLLALYAVCRPTHFIICVCVQSGGHVPLAGFKLPHVSIVRSGTCASRSLPHHPGQAVDPEALPVLGSERRPRPHLAFHPRRGRVLGTQRDYFIHLAHALGQVGVWITHLGR